jgi:hypothetical protein
MKNPSIATWTTVFTNMAVMIGLVFVGLEFNSNTKSIVAERLSGHTQTTSEITMVIGQDAELSDIFYRAYADPDSVTGMELDRYQNFLFVYHSSFVQSHHDYENGFLPEETWREQRQGIGFAFSSDLGLETVDIMLDSGMRDQSWELIRESALAARAYCMNHDNRCLARYEAARPK